ncbi:hypothetical protein ACIRUL_20625 [Streptomyces sp. NPDC101171]|uniref:hypothetical protein n=1 Tax=Streptomyces sp. NPDC101171 TaxID=3366122 RepID=UPI00380CD5FD
MGGELLLDIFREGATRLALISAAMHISVDFHMGESAGALEIQVTPAFCVGDRLLFQ